MPRRFTFDPQEDQEDYGFNPSKFSRRVKQNFALEENDPRFSPQPLKHQIGFVPDESEESEEDPDPYGYSDIISRYRRELGGEQPALSRYRQALQNVPQQQDYDLGKWGKLGAALSGFGAGFQDPAKGIAVATQLREAPWQRALKQHDKTLEGLGTEAEFEQDDRKNRMAGLKLELDSVKDRRTADTNEMNIMSQVQRRRAQTKAELDRLGLDWKKYDLDYIDKLSDNERDDLLARETGRHNLATESTANFNADSSRMNANTNVGKLSLDNMQFGHQQGRDRVKDYQWEAELAQNDRRIDKGDTPSWLAPNVQRDAQDLVTQDMIQDPQYRKFFSPDSRGYMSRKQLSAAEQLTPEYEAFEREFARRISAAENHRRSGNNSVFTRQQ